VTLAAIRQGIAANLSTISGLRTSWFVPDNPSPPIAIVVPERVDYDVSFARGSDTFYLNVLIIGGRINERTAQSSLDAFLDSTGTSSVKTAIESDKTLGGAAHSLRVTDWSGYGPLAIGDAQYLTVTFRVTVNAI
jgi:hypothetical protein